MSAETATSSGELEVLRRVFEAQRERLQKRASKLEESWEAKIASIKEKAAAAKAEAKTRHQQHVEKLARFAAAQKESFHQLFA